MVKRQFQKLQDTEGLYHKPEWYRPLLYGKHLYMNVTYLLPGVEMVMGSQREKDAEKLERAVFMLSGELELTINEEKFAITPETAFLVPREFAGPYIAKNVGDKTAKFMVVMSPPPHPELKTENRHQIIRRYLANNRPVKFAVEMQEFEGT